MKISKFYTLCALSLIMPLSFAYTVSVEPAYKHAPIPASVGTPDLKKEAFFKANGYYLEDSKTARSLLTIKSADSLRADIKKLAPSQGPVPITYNSLPIPKLAFVFNGLAAVKPDNILAYSVLPIDQGHGYEVVSTYFTDDNLGKCSLTMQYVGATNGGTIYSQDEVTYSVNGKPTEQEISGSDQSGYSYNLNWGDSKFSYGLTCANATYNKDLIAMQMELARQIDRQYGP